MTNIAVFLGYSIMTVGAGFLLVLLAWILLDTVAALFINGRDIIRAVFWNRDRLRHEARCAMLEKAISNIHDWSGTNTDQERAMAVLHCQQIRFECEKAIPRLGVDGAEPPPTDD